ncbi:hypothetical protein [Streptomyces sp. NPDC006289]|uniref:hypothetical protein n=1 Tax=Streptomyces sp. NPDC006289 TaxID=3156744 RepID=UPI0033A67925
MSTTLTLSPETVTNLVQLRSLMVSADRASRSNSYVTRPMAVVLLDAVNERATHFAATYLNLTIPNRAGFEQLMEIVKEELGKRWATGTWPDIRRLHRTRNLVQHEGLEVDQKNISIWASSTLSYTRSLVSAVWDTDINEVALAHAIKNREIRELLEVGERKHREGLPTESVKATNEAFKLAYQMWMTHYRRRIPFHSKPSSFDVLDKKSFGFLEREIGEVNETSLAISLAGDPGEYIWFRNLVAHREDIEISTLDEAQRALGFVFGWVTRWESFQDSFIPNRRVVREREKRRVRSSDRPAYVYDVKVEKGAKSFRLAIELADVPPAEEFDAWRSALRNLLNKENSPQRYWEVGESGSLGIWVSDDGADIDELANTASEALAAVEVEVRQDVTRRENSRLALEKESLAYDQELKDVKPGLPSWVESAYLKPEITITGGQARSRLEIKTSADAVGVWSPVIIRLHEHFSIKTRANWQDRTIGIEPELSAPELIQVLRDISEFTEDLITRKKEEDQRIEESRHSLETRIRELFRL